MMKRRVNAVFIVFLVAAITGKTRRLIALIRIKLEQLQSDYKPSRNYICTKTSFSKLHNLRPFSTSLSLYGWKVVIAGLSFNGKEETQGQGFVDKQNKSLFF